MFLEISVTVRKIQTLCSTRSIVHALEDTTAGTLTITRGITGPRRKRPGYLRQESSMETSMEPDVSSGVVSRHACCVQRMVYCGGSVDGRK